MFHKREMVVFMAVPFKKKATAPMSNTRLAEYSRHDFQSDLLSFVQSASALRLMMIDRALVSILWRDTRWMLIVYCLLSIVY